MYDSAGSRERVFLTITFKYNVNEKIDFLKFMKNFRLLVCIKPPDNTSLSNIPTPPPEPWDPGLWEVTPC